MVLVGEVRTAPPCRSRGMDWLPGWIYVVGAHVEGHSKNNMSYHSSDSLYHIICCHLMIFHYRHIILILCLPGLRVRFLLFSIEPVVVLSQAGPVVDDDDGDDDDDDDCIF